MRSGCAALGACEALEAPGVIEGFQAGFGDPRVAVAAAQAPALVSLYTQGQLGTLSVPTMLMSGRLDKTTPDAENARRRERRARLGGARRPGRSVGRAAERRALQFRHHLRRSRPGAASGDSAWYGRRRLRPGLHPRHRGGARALGVLARLRALAPARRRRVGARLAGRPARPRLRRLDALRRRRATSMHRGAAGLRRRPRATHAAHRGGRLLS
jgi:hypothetical protein